MIREAKGLADEVGVTKACQIMGIPRSTFYYVQKPRNPCPRKEHPRKLSDKEETEIRKKLNSERFQDQTPRDVYTVYSQLVPLYWMRDLTSAAGEPCIES
jgi:hypothetical protein